MVNAKRPEETSHGAESARRLEDAGLQLAAMRNLLEQHPAEKPSEKDDAKLSIFWRVFGGTIISVAALISVTLFNNMSSSIIELRGELSKANEARIRAIEDVRAELTRNNELKSDMIRKDEFNTQMKASYDRYQALQTQNNTQNATMTSLKTELDGHKERLTKLITDIELSRKEEMAKVEMLKKEFQAVTEAIKKDVATLDLLRERTMNLMTELKATREEVAKLRTDVDRNQAQDLERRDRRDAQYKAIDDSIKDLAKSFQEYREKLVRLETLTTTAMPPAGPGKKPVSPPEPPSNEPILEQAPLPHLPKKKL